MHDVTRSCQVPLFDDGTERFLGAHFVLDHAPHIAVCLVLLEGDAEQLFYALCLKCMDFSLCLSLHGLYLTPLKEV